MAMGGSSTQGAMLTEINVTPLVDVMLVLLIIFMITAPMLQTGVDVDLPEAKAQTIPDDEGKLILTVTSCRSPGMTWRRSCAATPS
jgi:biopolymer transport protein TolR